MFARKCGISLFSGTIGNNPISLGGNNFRTKSKYTGGMFVEEYSKLKDFIHLNFMTPLIQKKMDIIKLNAFNFEYLLKRLELLSTMFSDVTIFIKLIETIKSSIEIANENKELNELIYGQLEETTLQFKTSTVELKPEYQIYINLFGNPPTYDDFDKTKLLEIKKKIDNNKSITYRDLIIELGMDPTNVEEIEDVEAIDWKNLPEDPSERRKLLLQRNNLIKNIL